MTTPLRVTIDDTRGQQRIARLKGRFANFRPAMEGPVRELVRRAVIAQFRTEGEWGGRKWPELSEYTLRRKERAGVAHKGILKFSGKLYDSLTVVGHPSRRETITKRGYSLRTLVRSKDGFPYGASHQTGASNGRPPERQVIPDPMPPSFMRELRNIVRGHLIEVQFGPGRSRVR
jgi:hypothetical protein